MLSESVSRRFLPTIPSFVSVFFLSAVFFSVRTSAQCFWAPVPTNLPVSPLPQVLAAAFRSADAVFQAHQREVGIPGTVYGVAYKGQVFHVFGVGNRNASDRLSSAPDERTPFRIGSITKVLTTINLLHDVLSGCVSLSDSLQHVLQNFSISMPFRFPTKVTFADLLGQTSGMPRLTPCTSDVQCEYSTKEILNRIASAGIGMLYTAGFRGSYSNLGFSLVGHASEYICGRNGTIRYADLVREQVLKKWWLNDTGFVFDDELKSRIAVGLMQDPLTKQYTPAPLYSIGWNSPSGEAFSTIADLLRLADHLMHGLSFEDQLLSTPEAGLAATATDEVLDTYLRREFFRPSFVFNDNSAYGHPAEMFATMNGNLRMYSKDGAIYGYESMLVMQPDMDFSLAILSNRDSTGMRNITQMLSDIIVPAFVQAIGEAGPYPFLVPANPAQLRGVLGTFWLPRHLGSVKVGLVANSGPLNFSVFIGSLQLSGYLSFVESRSIVLPYFNNGDVFVADVYRLVNVLFRDPTISCQGEMGGYPMSEFVFAPCGAAQPTQFCYVFHLTMAYGPNNVLTRDDARDQPPLPPVPVNPVVPPAMPDPNNFCGDRGWTKKEKDGAIAALVILGVFSVVSVAANIVFWRKSRKPSGAAGNLLEPADSDSMYIRS
eukprot:ANDGO_06203.mRNA.1 Beta-lactamase-like protein 2